MSVQEVISVKVTRRSFTVAEYERMGQFGIFSKDERVELVCGEIIDMSPIGERHAACVARLTQAIALLIQRRAILWVQNPIRLNDHSEPQPDTAVLKPRADFYGQSLPAPEDVLLLIEVSDTTLEYDRQIKLPLYARAGVAEVWIVNLTDEQIETYRDPSGGAYQANASVRRGEEVEARTVASLRLGVAEILG
jgi:Uma2 family endonuclease